MTLVLDCEGIAKAVARDRELTAWLAMARADDERVITSAATLVEVIHPGIDRRAFDWLLSRLIVEPVTTDIARRAATLLQQVGRHGHRDALAAIVAATALTAPGPTTVLTSDPDDLNALCGGHVTVMKI